MKLVIVGNGLDLAHGIQTSYKDFKIYLEKHDSHLIETLESIYQKKDNYGDYAIWSDFENALGFPNVKNVNEVNKLFGTSVLGEFWVNNTLKKHFANWAHSAVIGKCESLPLNHPFRPYLIEENLFLTFNYTITLERIYEIRSINHIHGNAFWEENARDNNIIFGHAHIPGVSNEIVLATEKPVEKIISRNEKWFEELSRKRDWIDEVTILGFSYGCVDFPYFEKIVECLPNHRWSLFTYKKSDSDAAREYAWKMGLTDYLLIKM